MFPDAKLKIDMQHVITITLSEENAKNSYITNTTGLAVPSGHQTGLVR